MNTFTEAFKPMLAASFDEAVIRRYLLNQGVLMASPKLDGIRATRTCDGNLLSRSLKLIPNAYVQDMFGGNAPTKWYDGELIAGEPNSPTVYNDTFSAVMNAKDKPKLPVTFWVFDHTENPDAAFIDRYAKLVNSPNVRMVPQRLVKTYEEVLEMEADVLAQGFEGLMLRSPRGLYKFGRSTHKQMYLCKVKRDTDDVAQILDIYEGMHNGNEAFENELGQIDRSTHAENLTPNGMAGGFTILYNGMTFNCAMGKFDHEQRREILQNKDVYIRDYVLEFKYFGIGNIKAGKAGAPRHPRGVKFRSKLDT